MNVVAPPPPPVDAPERAPEAGHDPEALIREARERARRRRLAAVVLACCLAGVGAYVAFGGGGAAPSIRAGGPDAPLLRTPGPALDGLPEVLTYTQWSPNAAGTWIANAAGGVHAAIHLVLRDGSTRELAPGLVGISWSPDGTKLLAYAWPSVEEGATIVLVDKDGSVGPPVATDVAVGPFWSPDGSRIAFQSHAKPPTSNEAIYVADSDGRNVHLVASNALSSSYAHGGLTIGWSPDGKQLAYAGWGAAGYGLYLVDPSGRSTPVRVPTAGIEVFGGTTFSPDGSRIAFATRADTKQPIGVYTVRPDGAELRRRGHGFGPAWSPDGTLLAFHHLVQAPGREHYDVAVARSDGDSLRLIPCGCGRGGGASSSLWSSDGTRIAFTSGRFPNAITTVKPDGTDPTRIVLPPRLGAWQPFWQPLAPN